MATVIVETFIYKETDAVARIILDGTDEHAVIVAPNITFIAASEMSANKGSYTFESGLLTGLAKVQLFTDDTEDEPFGAGWENLVTDPDAIIVCKASREAALPANVDISGVPPVSITINPAEAAAALVAGQIALVRSARLVATITLGNITGRTKLVWTAKRVEDAQANEDTDALSVFQIDEDDGLIVLAGSAALTAAFASIVVTDETTGDTTITIEADASQLAPLVNLVWDCKVWSASSKPRIAAAGIMSVTAAVTHAIE